MEPISILNIILSLLGAIAIGALIAVSGVALGGFLVYKTKREEGRVFRKHEQDEVEGPIILDEYGGEEAQSIDIPDAIQDRHNEFVSQFAANLGPLREDGKS